MRSAVRFPLHLPIQVVANSAQHDAETSDISAGGVLFRLDADIQVGSAIEFNISMPSEILGTGTDVKVHCVGRIVRSFEEKGRRALAAVIDEYSFERP
jgi:PilZ domain